MSFISYAQNFEDVRLWRAFSDVAEGRYLDIGTQDPVHDSVSLAFYERGWRGVHVEPTPAYAAAMRAARPDETVIEAAVSTAPGLIEFYEIPETGLSTGLSQLAQQHAEAGWTTKVLTVPTVTLAALFDLMGPDPIHWLKIDVEGMEPAVLASWGDHPARPAALVIEATAPTTQVPTHSAWYDLVLSRGYRDVLFDGLSRYFIHESAEHRAEALALSPNVFDGFQVIASHFVAGKLQQDHEAEAEAVRIAAQAEADAACETIRAELAGELETNARALSETREELAARLEQNLALAREAGELQGQLAAQAEAAAAKLRDAERHREDLSNRLSALDGRLTDRESELRDERTKRENLAAELLSAQTAFRETERQLTATQAAQNEAETTVRELRVQVLTTEQQLTATKAAQKETEAALGGLEARLAELHAQSARQQAALAQATELLVHVPDPIAGWPRRLATVLARLAGQRPEAVAAARAARIESWRAAHEFHNIDISFDDNFTIAENTNFVDLAATLRNPFMPADESPITSVPRLLAPHDAEFIRVAYQAVLGRAPDPEGGTYYLARLRTGTHKLEILRQLRRSAEGRAFVPGVAGLDRAIRRHRRSNWPLFGPVIRLFTAGESNNPTHRQMRMLINEVGRLGTLQAVVPIAENPQHVVGSEQSCPSSTAAIGTGRSLSVTGGKRPGLAGFFQTKIWSH